MKAIMCVDKIVLNGSDIVGNGDINDLRKKKKLSTVRRKMMKDVIPLLPVLVIIFCMAYFFAKSTVIRCSTVKF